MKQKTNISVKNILGQRITPSMEIGSGGDYASGDILDANATDNLINKKLAEIPQETGKEQQKDVQQDSHKA